MFTIGPNVDNYYRLYVSGGNLIGQRKVAGAKTTLFSISYDAVNHRFLRIRHSAGSMIMETAPSNGAGGPGTWIPQYTQMWSSAVSLGTLLFEVKGGTSQAEVNAAGKVIFDNFMFTRNTAPQPPTLSTINPTSGPTAGGTALTLIGSQFALGATVSIGGVSAANVVVTSATNITATAPVHAAGPVSVTVTNPDGQSATLVNGYTYTAPTNVLLEDNFNDNVLDTAKWNANDLFSGFTDTGVPLNETSQRLEIGPLLLNTGGSHYRGIRTVNTYDFTNGAAYVELVQAAPATTGADSMFTIGSNVDNYYRLYVSGGSLIGQRKIAGTKTTLFTITYNATNHRFLRIRHNAGSMILETAPSNGAGGPGTWTQQYSEIWSSAVPVAALLFELKGGTWQAEANAPDKIIFDSFLASK
jgi:hypothetical protein